MTTSINCAVVGDSRVGKTSLLTRYTKENFSRDYLPTVFIDHFENIIGIPKNGRVELNLWDTSGQEGPEGLKPLCMLEIDVCVICYSVMSPDSFESVSSKWVTHIKSFHPNAAIVLVGTMQDLLNNENELDKLERANKSPISYYHGKELASKIGALKYIECSALTGLEVKTLFDTVVHATCLNVTHPSEKKCAVM